jgi:hypothetical protein
MSNWHTYLAELIERQPQLADPEVATVRMKPEALLRALENAYRRGATDLGDDLPGVPNIFDQMFGGARN